MTVIRISQEAQDAMRLIEAQGTTEDREPIAYEVAMKKPSKDNGKNVCFYLTTEVLWSRELEEKATQCVFFESLGKEIEVISPKVLNEGLPRGYKMKWHESWKRLRKEAYNPYSNEYSFDEFLAIRRDGNALGALAIPLGIPNSPDSSWEDTEGDKPTIDHEDYWQILWDIEEDWDSWQEVVREFFHSKIDEAMEARLSSRGELDRPEAPEVEIEKLAKLIYAEAQSRSSSTKSPQLE